MTWREDARSIQWKTFEGAYGKASTILGELEDIAAGRDEGSVSYMHQGDVYEVTPHIIPFIVAIAEDVAVDAGARAMALEVLEYMAKSEPPNLMGDRYNPFTRQMESACTPHRIAHAEWTRATHDALVKQRERIAVLAKLQGDARLCAAARATLVALDGMARKVR
jgi:hypothetical protein